jgi:hypothetical protein
MKIGLRVSTVGLLLACGGGLMPACDQDDSSCVPVALAVPRVTFVSGAVEDQGLVTIRGSGFGTKTVAEPYRWDDFDSGVPGERLLDEGAGGWYTSSAQAGRWPRYAVDRTRYPGTQSALQDFTNGNYNQTIGLTDLPDAPLYVSGWFYLTTWGAPSRNVKMIQIRMGELESLQWEGRVDQAPSTDAGHQYVHDCDASDLVPPMHTWDIGDEMWLDQWHRLESWLDQGTPGGNDGVWTIWIDGQPWTELRGTFMDSVDCPFDHLYVGHYFASDEGTPQPQAQRWWDELYVDSTLARVEIGDAPTWSGCAHREIQVPQAWSGDAITIRVNQGAFASGQRAYLYVVDENGVVNSQGFSLILGG